MAMPETDADDLGAAERHPGVERAVEVLSQVAVVSGVDGEQVDGGPPSV